MLESDYWSVLSFINQNGLRHCAKPVFCYGTCLEQGFRQSGGLGCEMSATKLMQHI